ncbi:MAG TPA: apolipoprotein N-acyltransferase [Deltaproteobacteria bacterium]|nr:MAG: apolipoprotein N-acyltransferase [Deltaproteobacteria bacterium GWA2_55_82]OGQ61983.1 MAG: apolipoprotein N-acyltransferase [Deltaproteobacteria bacterium RIFCSPLOWO2_02_FULL_55_12]OIJ74678.1 MAG: apolipoprotein N-acyltransferase [Deltaproteobacteria bacterium GWC2_55_46]HBG46378.1 apolipoprotein N-acyltransferase [Deltaproteobacteria bacterium]HCY10589.1 apolipoprotein N-acyltransferase [Deltaproteobacteria bacterium]
MRPLALALISGISLVFAFPPFGLGALAWFTFIPLILALEGQGKLKGFLLGIASGAAFSLGAVYWVVHSMSNYGGVPVYASIAVMLLLVIYLSLYWGVFGLVYTLASPMERTAKLLIAPAVWVALEYMRGYLLTGFPWVLVGYTQSDYLPLIQVADTTGVWGVSFAVIAFNTAASFAASYLLRREGRAPVLPLAIAAALVATIASYGFVRMKAVDRDVERWSGIKVGVAQGSIDQAVKWDGRYQDSTIDIYTALTAEASDAMARLVIWPETAIPFYYEPGKVKDGPVGEIARKSGSYILTGSPSYTYNPVSNEARYFNSAYLLNPLGDTVGKYDKFHLVPFGEYVPLRGMLPFEKLTAGIGDFDEGSGPVPIPFEGGGIGTLVCFESIFPEISRGHVRGGATVLANLTNDAWFGYTSAPYQHFQMSVFRAVENKSFLVRAANTGISAVIDPNGRVRKKTGLFERTMIVDEVRMRQGALTFYTMYGDLFALGCSVIAAVFVGTRLKRRR